jgi:talin
MDEETREIFKEAPIQHLRRWAAAANSFTLDFGDHENDYFVLETKEGEAISSLLAGYIDILLKKQKRKFLLPFFGI